MATKAVDEAFANTLKAQQQKFGKDSVYVASDHDAAIPVIRCPTAFGYFIGGADGIPASGCLGCDGVSGNYKTAFSFEFSRWHLIEGGIAYRVDNEERTPLDYMRSFYADLDWDTRGRIGLAQVSSVEAWQEHVTELKKQARKFKDLSPGERFTITAIVDSLTGSGTRSEEKAVDTAGSAAEKAFSGAAQSIARYYKSLTFRGTLFSLFHVQHAKKTQDQYATDPFVANGGDAPRFQANLHFRCTNQKAIEKADFQGRDLTLQCVKAWNGPNKRKLVVRLKWWHEWRFMPQYDTYTGDDGEFVYDLYWQDEKTLSIEDARKWWDTINPFVPRAVAEKLRFEMNIAAWDEHKEKIEDLKAKLEQPKITKAVRTKTENEITALEENPPSSECKAPLAAWEKVQISKFDWDYSLGWLVADYINEGYAADKQAMNNVFNPDPDVDPFDKTVKDTFVTTSNCNNDMIKCESVFGDKDPRSYSELGAAIEADPELLRKVKAVLGIKRKMHFREVPVRETTDGGKQKKKKK